VQYSDARMAIQAPDKALFAMEIRTQTSARASNSDPCQLASAGRALLVESTWTVKLKTPNHQRMWATRRSNSLQRPTAIACRH